jgi:hypothetical protein
VTTESWEELAIRYGSYVRVPAALAAAGLLRAVGPRWGDHVDVASWWVHGLRFSTKQTPSPEDVRVTWTDGIWTIELVRVETTADGRPGGAVRVAADSCRDANAEAVLDAFLVQLVGGEPPAPSE